MFAAGYKRARRALRSSQRQAGMPQPHSLVVHATNQGYHHGLASSAGFNGAHEPASTCQLGVVLVPRVPVVWQQVARALARKALPGALGAGRALRSVHGQDLAGHLSRQSFNAEFQVTSKVFFSSDRSTSHMSSHKPRTDSGSRSPTLREVSGSTNIKSPLRSINTASAFPCHAC